jgi:CopA family copper-resistance protein
MKYFNDSSCAPLSESRRQFVQGVGSTLLVGLGGRFSMGAQSPPAELTGTEFDLSVGELPLNFTGRSRIGTAVNGQVPAPLLRWRQGDTVTVRVTNRLSVPTSIHWHGLIVPADMDGVPGLSFSGIGAGETFTYRFKVNQSGTYWYHSHSRFQEQIGLYGPIIVERRDQNLKADREHVILLSDWTDIDPEHIYRTLKLKSDYFNFGQRTASDFFRDMREQGFSRAIAERSMWGQMRMNPTDLLDVSGYAYTYLMNGITPANNWTGIFKRGEKVRLRFINGSSMSIFDVRIPGLKLTIVSADGQEVDPVTVDEFRIAAAETYDVIVEPKDDSAYTIFAQALDRSGFARGTLAPQIGMQSDVPSVDPRPLLTMVDMAMAHDMSGMDPSAMDHGAMGHGSEGTTKPPQHTREEYGPTVDSLAKQPQSRLDDPGVGLRGNGRRVLTYADLHTIGGPIDHRMPGRQIELHLTGHMQRFIWSFNGQKFSQAEPLRFNHGERLRIVLINDSMMTHPIHLHGMWSELETEHGEFLVRKHSVMVQPGQRISYAVTADALGRWAFHCHLLYHMEAGMFREVVVAHAKDGA